MSIRRSDNMMMGMMRMMMYMCMMMPSRQFAGCVVVR